MYKIIPVTLPIFGVMDQLEIKVIDFYLFPEKIMLYYKLSGETKAIDGNLVLPESVVSVWGTDDTVVLDYVLEQLGVELAPEPTEE